MNTVTQRLGLRVRALRGEGGFAVLTAIALMAIMLGAGLTIVSYTDNETQQSGTSRVRETSFNLSESALHAQVFALARRWPGVGSASQPYTTCQPSTGGSSCPSNTQLLALFPTSDAGVGATWTTEVHDNDTTKPTFYSDALISSQPGYDANDDGQVWVRAQATTRGRTRTIVALVRAEEQVEDMLHAALLSGRMDLGNNGNKVVIDNTLGGGGAILVRCTPVDNESNACMGYKLGSGNTKTQAALDNQLAQQITPASWTVGYTGGTAMSADTLQRLKDTAVANGTHYTSCPASLTGEMVWIETASCSYQGSSTFNSAQAPGMLLIDGGTLTLKGSATFYGVVYAPNTANSSSTLVSLTGNACVNGGVLVEGLGVTELGNSGSACGGAGNVQYNPNSFGSAKSIGTAGIVQNTWREIVAG